MKEQLVSKEAAQLACEKQFKESTEANYWLRYKDKDDESKMFLAENNYELEGLTELENERYENV